MRNYNVWSMPMLNRAKELREAGLSYGAIATVLNLDFDCTLTKHSTRAALLSAFDMPRDYSRNPHFARNREAV